MEASRAVVLLSKAKGAASCSLQLHLMAWQLGHSCPQTWRSHGQSFSWWLKWSRWVWQMGDPTFFWHLFVLVFVSLITDGQLSVGLTVQMLPWQQTQYPLCFITLRSRLQYLMRCWQWVRTARTERCADALCPRGKRGFSRQCYTGGPIRRAYCASVHCDILPIKHFSHAQSRYWIHFKKKLHCLFFIRLCATLKPQL